MFQVVIMYSYMVRPSTLRRYQALLFFGGNHIYKNNNSSDGYIVVCHKSISMMIKRTMEDISMIIVAFCLIMVLPTYFFFFKHQHTLIMPSILPFTDPESDFGYCVNFVHHIILGFVVIFYQLGSEITNEIIKNTICVQSDIICYSVKQMNELVQTKATNQYLTFIHFHDILDKVNDFDRFFKEFVDLFYWRFLIQPFVLTLSVGLGLFIFFVVTIKS